MEKRLEKDSIHQGPRSDMPRKNLNPYSGPWKERQAEDDGGMSGNLRGGSVRCRENHQGTLQWERDQRRPCLRL